MKRNVFSLLLALSLVNISCGGNAELPKTSDTSGETTTAAETTVKSVGFEKSDFGGAEFCIIAPNHGTYPLYYFADEQTGEVMNDSVYKRKQLVEDYANVKLTNVFAESISDLPTKVLTSVQAGDDEYQMALTHCFVGLQGLVTQSALYDWNELEYVDLSAEHYYKDCNESLSLNGKQYFTYSDYMLPVAYFMIFNKDMVKDFKLDDPYEIVRSGDWTVDKMIELSKAVTADLNSDGIMDGSDRFGLSNTSDASLWSAFMYGAGIKLLGYDGNGDLALTLDENKMATLIEKLDSMMNGQQLAFQDHEHANADEINGLNITTNRCLFQLYTALGLANYRDTPVDFGILPMPKLDKNQESYCSSDWGGFMCIPATIGNPEMVGKVAELLSYHSTDTTAKTYRELILGEKLSRDEGSNEMLDIIFDNIIYDPAMTYFGQDSNIGGLLYTVSNLVVNGQDSSFSSYFASKKDACKTAIESFNDELEG